MKLHSSLEANICRDNDIGIVACELSEYVLKTFFVPESLQLCLRSGAAYRSSSLWLFRCHSALQHDVMFRFHPLLLFSVNFEDSLDERTVAFC